MCISPCVGDRAVSGDSPSEGEVLRGLVAAAGGGAEESGPTEPRSGDWGWPRLLSLVLQPQGGALIALEAALRHLVYTPKWNLLAFARKYRIT